MTPRHLTGFTPLDDVLGGGLRQGDLVLVGGKPGVGKTVLALQWAQSIAATRASVTYLARREHPDDLIRRLEAAAGTSRSDTAGVPSPTAGIDLAPTIVEGWRDDDDLGILDQLREQRSGREGEPAAGAHDVLVIDDLDATPGRELVALARRARCVVVALVACNATGLSARRTRLHHLRCAPSDLHDADVVLVLNDKAPIVSCAHLALDRREAGPVGDRTVISVEKNRSGPSDVHLEFRRDFARARFEPAGVWVSERLYDETATDH